MQSFMGFHQSLQFFLELQDDICGLINMTYCTSDLQVLYLFYLAHISLDTNILCIIYWTV